MLFRSPRRDGGAGATTLGLLIGGDSGTVRYQPGDWERLLQLLSKGDSQLSWIVSNSRRTPAHVSDQIAAYTTRDPRVRFVDVRQPGAMKLADLFAACDGVVATIDSSSMISEAVWARKPVVVLEPQIAQLPDLEQGYRAYLTNGGWITTLPLAAATPMALETQFRAASPLKTNPLDDLAALLQARLPALFK